MTLPAETQDEIRAMVRGGFEERDRIVEIFCEEMYEPGYCFYHQQDLERVVAGGNLLLAVGPIDPDKEETEGPTIGRIIVDLVKGAGFSVEWPGAFDKRIEITGIGWKRR